MRNKRNPFLFAFATILILNVISLNAFATVVPVQPINNEIITPQAEVTEWVFRYNENGVLQKRLWSRTYAKWLTDWINVN